MKQRLSVLFGGILLAACSTLQAGLSVDRTSLDLGVVLPGQRDPPTGTLILANQGSAPLQVAGAALVGPGAGCLSIAVDPGGQVLWPDDTVNVGVGLVCAPEEVGSATLTVDLVLTWQAPASTSFGCAGQTSTWGVPQVVSVPVSVTFLCDLDGDGFDAWDCGGDDCDDAVDTIAPGAPERCDYEDQDCDGVDDEDAIDASTWYTDADGDGYGDPEDPVVSCLPPLRGVLDGTDCDDTDSRLYPGAQDLPDDGLDQDCDGGDLCWADADQDGARGEPAVSADLDCADPGEAGSLAPEDCDDGDPAAYPGARETCDGVDEDCDGEVDEGASEATWYRDLDGDGWGAGDPTSSCTPPSGTVALSGDCDDGDRSRYPGAPETCGDGVVNDCEGSEAAALAACSPPGPLPLALAEVALYGAPGDGLGASLAWLDGDGDGWMDLVAGSPGGDLAAVDGGAAWVLAGPLTGTPLPVLPPSTPGSRAGTAVSGGDLDGDGLDDLLLGAPGDGGEGQVWAVPGVVGEPRVLLASLASGDGLGSAVAAVGDTDGDGLEDVLLGAPGDGAGAGAAWLLLGPCSGATADGRIGGGATFGRSVAAAGDTDGDGYGDVLAGYGDQVRAVLVRGPLPAELEDGDADALFSWEAGGSDATLVAGAGDVDGDGLDDLVVGQGGAASPAGWVLAAPLSGSVDLSAHPDALILPGGATSVAGVEDLDGDGLDDVALGLAGSGAFLFAGPATGGRVPSDAWATLLLPLGAGAPVLAGASQVVAMGDPTVGGGAGALWVMDRWGW